MILRVEAGRKVINGVWEARVPAGALTLMPPRVALDVENHPAPDGPYRATGVMVPAGLAIPTGKAQVTHCEDSRALAAFDRALELQRRLAVPQPIRDHAVLEVLLWLDALGLRLPKPGPLGLVERVRLLLSGDLARDWTAAELATELATSEATLRRRLAAAGTGLADLVTDMRMTRALGLLQTSDRPVRQIAHEVGYASPSRFALRFRARFGLSPSRIRESDRDGTMIDRLRIPAE